MDALVSQEELLVDPIKGYPLGYAKLTRLAALHTGTDGHFAPKGPPSAWTPNDDADLAANAIWFEQQFPVVEESQRDRACVVGYESILWTKLKPCLGFDPSCLRVDKFGNVIHRRAAPNTILAGCIDHYYPVASENLTRFVGKGLCWGVVEVLADHSKLLLKVV